MRYIIYARKSTEEDDRQVLSIEAQLVELKEFAAKEKLEIVASLCEAKTAKEPDKNTCPVVKRSFYYRGRLEPYFAESGIYFCPEKSVRFGRRDLPKAGRGIDFSNVVPSVGIEPTSKP